MKKDCRYYENKLREMQDAKYRLIAEQMKLDGVPHDQIVEAIMKANASDVTQAIAIDQNQKGN